MTPLGQSIERQNTLIYRQHFLPAGENRVGPSRRPICMPIPAEAAEIGRFVS